MYKSNVNKIVTTEFAKFNRLTVLFCINNIYYCYIIIITMHFLLNFFRIFHQNILRFSVLCYTLQDVHVYLLNMLSSVQSSNMSLHIVSITGNYVLTINLYVFSLSFSCFFFLQYTNHGSFFLCLDDIRYKLSPNKCYEIKFLNEIATRYISCE